MKASEGRSQPESKTWERIWGEPPRAEAQIWAALRCLLRWALLFPWLTSPAPSKSYQLVLSAFCYLSLSFWLSSICCHGSPKCLEHTCHLEVQDQCLCMKEQINKWVKESMCEHVHERMRNDSIYSGCVSSIVSFPFRELGIFIYTEDGLDLLVRTILPLTFRLLAWLSIISSSFQGRNSASSVCMYCMCLFYKMWRMVDLKDVMKQNELIQLR